MTSLAIFDIDGTLTDTTAIDDACYRRAVSETLGLEESAIDWSGTPHFSDRGIFDWLCIVHARRHPWDDAVAAASARLGELFDAALAADPGQFLPIAGAPAVFDHLAANGWHVSVATGCWWPSARIKLRAAGIHIPDALIACSDDAASRADIVNLSRTRAAAFYGADFSRVVSIGDGTWDVETAAILGLPFIGVGHGERAARLRQIGAATVIQDYTDLAAFTNALAAARVPGGE